METKKFNEFGTEKLVKAIEKSSEESQQEIIENWRQLIDN